MNITFDPHDVKDVILVRQIVGVPEDSKMDRLLDLLGKEAIPGLGRKAYDAIKHEVEWMERGIQDA